MPQGDGTGPQGRGPRSDKTAARSKTRGRDSVQQGRGGKGAGRRQGQATGKPAGRGQGRRQGRGRQS